MNSFVTRAIAWAAAWLALPCFTLGAEPNEPPPNLKALGGRWFVQATPTPVYYFRDADRYVDLFSYHTLDSNKDGIENVRLKHDDKFLLVESQGYPNHPTAVFPNSRNPNSIRVQQFSFRFPLEPQRAEKITRLPQGPIGMALNGVVFFNPFEFGGLNAVEGYAEEWLDSCCGHPQRTGIYHYHKYPSCVKSPFPDDGKQHSPVIGFAFDGFPVHGPYEGPEQLAKNLTGAEALDVCNGHSDPVRGYHYHVTPGKFPYILGGFAGVVERSNSRPLAQAGEGPIENKAQGESRLDQVIAAVRPGSAARGQKHTVRIELAPDQARRVPLPQAPPSWVQIGPFEGKKIAREGNVVTAEIEIRADAPLGVLLDCHLEFAAAGESERPAVFKRNEAFRVVEE